MIPPRARFVVECGRVRRVVPLTLPQPYSSLVSFMYVIMVKDRVY